LLSWFAKYVVFKKAGISHNELEAEKQKKVKVDYRCRVSEWILVLGSQPAGDVNHKPSGRLQLLSARPAVTLAIRKRAATNLAAW